MHCDFAPMEGVTGYVYRNLHRAVFGGADRYYLPFVSVGQSRAFSRREWQDLCPEHNTAGDLVPQLLGKDAEGFIWAARALRERGYKEINLNLGCPSGTVTAKGKGAGFLAHPEELERFLDTVFSALEGPISIKTRLGFADPAEFEALAALYGRYPLLALLLGFASLGVVLLPGLTAVFGLSLSFSVSCFTAAFGSDGVLLAAAVFGIRCAVTLPVYFLLAVPSWSNAAALAAASLGKGRRTAPVVYGRVWWLRAAVCAAVLLAGMGLELFFSPWLLELALQRVLG